jgi:hypothetical protein
LILHHDVLAKSLLQVFLAEKAISTMDLPYFHNLASADFWLFPEL